LSFDRKNEEMVRENPDEIEKLKDELNREERQKLLEIIRTKLNKGDTLTPQEQEFLDLNYESFKEHFDKT